jgi:phage terminase Nu1 subunit (DNA packaging protein)
MAIYWGVSTQAIDGWIARGCPVDRSKAGRVTAMHLGDVVMWAATNLVERESQARLQSAIDRYVAMLEYRAAEANAATECVDALVESGLSRESAQLVAERIAGLMRDTMATELRMPASSYPRSVGSDS